MSFMCLIYRNNSKQIIDLYVNPETIKSLEKDENVDLETVLRLDISQTWSINEHIDKMDVFMKNLMMFKRHCKEKKKTNHRLGENFAKQIPDKGLISRTSGISKCSNKGNKVKSGQNM